MTARLVCLMCSISGWAMLGAAPVALGQTVPGATQDGAPQGRRVGSRIEQRQTGQKRLDSRIPTRIPTRLETRLDNRYRVDAALLKPLEQSKQSVETSVGPK